MHSHSNSLTGLKETCKAQHVVVLIYRCNLRLLVLLAATSLAAIRNHAIDYWKITNLYQQNQDYRL